MTWQIDKPQLFHVNNETELTQALITLKSIGSIDGHSVESLTSYAHIFKNEEYYVLCIPVVMEIGGDVVYKVTSNWFLEAVIALSNLLFPPLFLEECKKDVLKLLSNA